MRILVCSVLLLVWSRPALGVDAGPDSQFIRDTEQRADLAWTSNDFYPGARWMWLHEAGELDIERSAIAAAGGEMALRAAQAGAKRYDMDVLRKKAAAAMAAAVAAAERAAAEAEAMRRSGWSND